MTKNKTRIGWRASGAIAVTAIMLAAGFIFVREDIAGQQRTSPATKNQLVGFWRLVSAESEQNGKRTDGFGPNPVGLYIFDASGRFAFQVIGSGLPKFASGNRYQGTPEENKAVVQGFIAFFGTNKVIDRGTLILHILGSSYPNFDGTDQKRSISIKGDVMQYSSAATSFGASAHQLWKRLGPGDKLTN
jgi:Lipocalin-like domain